MCSTCMKAYNKIWYQINKDKHRESSRKRRLNRMLRYGGTQEDYQKLFDAQKGLCSICGVSDKPLVVDHCHICGLGDINAVRGLLCWLCNNQSSFSLEKPEVLKRALEYAIIHIDKYHVPPSFNG